MIGSGNRAVSSVAGFSPAPAHSRSRSLATPLSSLLEDGTYGSGAGHAHIFFESESYAHSEPWAVFSAASMVTPSILHVSFIVLRKNVVLLAATSVLTSSRDVAIRANMLARRCER